MGVSTHPRVYGTERGGQPAKAAAKLAESGSMILTAHSFLPSLAEVRLGWSRAVLRTRSVRASWCFAVREAIRPNRSGTCTYSTFPDNVGSDLEFDRTLSIGRLSASLFDFLHRHEASPNHEL